MAKKAFVYDGSQWVDIAQSTADLSTYQKSNRTGLQLVVPTSVTGGTVSANGAVTIGSAVSSVTVNGVFSATYDNYKIVISSGGTVGNDYGSLRLGSSTSTYNYAAQTLQYATAAFGGFGVGANASEFRYVWSNANSTGYTGNIELQNPFLAQYTRLTSDYATDDYRFFMGGVHKTAASYTSFTLGPNAFTGTLTGGTIRIYGYNNGV